jgi:hypothetical protein
VVISKPDSMLVTDRDESTETVIHGCNRGLGGGAGQNRDLVLFANDRVAVRSESKEGASVVAPQLYAPIPQVQTNKLLTTIGPDAHAPSLALSDGDPTLRI